MYVFAVKRDELWNGKQQAESANKGGMIPKMGKIFQICPWLFWMSLDSGAQLIYFLQSIDSTAKLLFGKGPRRMAAVERPQSSGKAAWWLKVGEHLYVQDGFFKLYSGLHSKGTL